MNRASAKTAKDTQCKQVLSCVCTQYYHSPNPTTHRMLMERHLTHLFSKTLNPKRPLHSPQRTPAEIHNSSWHALMSSSNIYTASRVLINLLLTAWIIRLSLVEFLC